MTVCTQPQIIDSQSLIAETPELNAKKTNITISDGKITITWEAVPNADSYEISRAKSRLGNYSIIGTVTDSKFTDNFPNKNRYENYYKIRAIKEQETLFLKLISFELKLFGPNMRFYDIKNENISVIQNEINLIHDNEMYGGVIDNEGRTGEFSSKRYALYLKPGNYSGLNVFRIGFYTHLGGLGIVPAQTKINGSIETPPHLPNNNATCTFWRSIENMEVNGGNFRWGVSQAAPARRMKVTVPAQFDWNIGWASGGFSADCSFTNEAGSWSQQQWYARNSHFSRGFYGVNWNKVMQGCTGRITGDDWISGGCTTKLDTTPIIREKPFLCIQNGEYKVFVPALRKNSSGVSWSDRNPGPGVFLDIISDFYVVIEGHDTADTINAALDKGKHLFFTPGRYYLDKPIHVKKEGTVVLGTGYATLIPRPQNRFGALFIDDVPGVTVAGLLFDALYSSTYLLNVGRPGSSNNHSSSPVLLSDIFLRVGGFTDNNVNTDIALVINSNDVIGDHFWIWRADHGRGVGWDKNTTKYGILVTGERVTVYGLFVEHFHEYQTVWIGDNGRMYFYQSETPYDPFDQAGYRSHRGTVDGWASYKVANTVNNHLAVGLGIYAVFNRTGRDRRKSQSIFIENAIEVPDKSGVTVRHACIIDISGADTDTVKTGIRSIVNGTGKGIGGEFAREYIVSYNNGNVVTNSGSTAAVHPGNEVFYIPINLLP